MSDSLLPHGLEPTRLLCPQDSPGKNTGVGCCALLQGIFPTQGANLHLFHLVPLAPPEKLYDDTKSMQMMQEFIGKLYKNNYVLECLSKITSPHIL